MGARLYDSLKYRSIGPTRGGRVVAVAGDPGDRRVFYFGSTGGGIWKTTDGGTIWENVSDGYLNWASIGALAVAESDPNVIYAGMGETTIRGNVSRGDGVYRSTDAGRSWRHLGLADSQNIGSILVHPHDPDLVYVAAFGHVWGPNDERGVYRSQDGGKSWERVLHRNDRTGALDLTMDPNNPRLIYVSFWEAHRTPYSLESGGPGSGIFKTEDGGDSWEELTDKPGLPGGLKGKIGLAASPAQSGRVWAIIEAEEQPGLYRSDDFGETWTFLTGDANLIQRPWYWMHAYADPNDADTVWLPNFELWKSIDGGKTFQIVATPHVDNHGFWIDPHDSERIIMGNDGGACVSYNGGATWSTLYNQPTGEFYHVICDNQHPYRVYGAQQDNTTMSIPSRSNNAAINFTEWQEIGGGESGYIAVRPDNPDIIFAGSYQGLLTRLDRKTGLAKNITVWPENASGWAAKDLKYRFQWTSPTLLSPHDPDILMTAGNRLFRSTDEGGSWSTISPDLTRADPETLGPSGGPITLDQTGAETYGTIFAVAESPLQQGLLWAGSDDGLVWLSRDGGDHWANLNPPELPDWALISIIEASPHQPGKAYVAATRYKSHDDRPYLFKTTDFGESWTTIVDGIPDNEFTRAIREDPEVEGLLFAGTERGMYVSFDDGGRWESLRLNLPVVPIHDFVIHEGDLVVATHGRSFWIIDDISPLRQLARNRSEPAVRLFKPGNTYRYGVSRDFGHGPIPGLNLSFAGGLVATYRRTETPDGEPENVYLDAGNNPPDGVVIHYWLKDAPEQPVTLRILDAAGHEVRAFSSEKVEGKKEPRVSAQAGANRFVWDFRYPEAVAIENDEVAKTYLAGPKSAPGEYRVELTANGQTLSETFRVLGDPRVGATDEDFQAQFALQLQVRDKITAIHEAVSRMRKVRAQTEQWELRLDDDELRTQGSALRDKLTGFESRLVQVKAKGPKDRLKYPVLENARLNGLMGAIASAEGRPNQQCYELFIEISFRVDAALADCAQALETDLPALNALIASKSPAAIDLDG